MSAGVLHRQQAELWAGFALLAGHPEHGVLLGPLPHDRRPIRPRLMGRCYRTQPLLGRERLRAAGGGGVTEPFEHEGRNKRRLDRVESEKLKGDK